MRNFRCRTGLKPVFNKTGVARRNFSVYKCKNFIFAQTRCSSFYQASDFCAKTAIPGAEMLSILTAVYG